MFLGPTATKLDPTGACGISPEDVQYRLHQSQQGYGTATDVSQVEHEANAATNLRPQSPADHEVGSAPSHSSIGGNGTH